MLPLHEVHYKQGASFAQGVVKAHRLTSDDCMSKIGSKYAALQSDPVKYLSHFAETDILSE